MRTRCSRQHLCLFLVVTYYIIKNGFIDPNLFACKIPIFYLAYGPIYCSLFPFQKDCKEGLKGLINKMKNMYTKV